MPTRRVIQVGHLLAGVFVALLLVGGRNFLGAHPLLAAVLLAAFAPVYYFAARITGYRQFLYGAILLAVLAYHLILEGAGVALADQPLLALIPLAAIYFAAERGLPARIAAAAGSLYGSINLLIAVYALWILLRVPWFFTQAPLGTSLALGGYGLYCWLRFTRTEEVAYGLSAIVLVSGGFLCFLYGFPHLAVLLGAVAAMRLVSELFDRGVLRPLETFAFALVGAYLILVGLSATRAAQLPLGYLALAMIWLHLGVALYRPLHPPARGPQTVLLPRLLPLFAGGIVLGLLPVALFYPWNPLTLAISFLAIFFVVFLATSRELARQSLSLIGVVLTRVLSGLGRLAPAAAFAYLAYARFPASYELALGALAIGFLSLLAGWRQEPRVLTRRNVYVYQAGVFLTLAYFLAERRLAPTGALGTLLDSAALLVLALITAGYLLRARLPRAYLQSLYDVAHVAAAAAACLLVIERGVVAIVPALQIGLLLLVATGLAYLKVRRPAVLFTLPVVLGLWVYVAAWTAGVRGEMLGMPYFVWGLLAAAVGYVLLRRQNSWHELFYFMWFFFAGVSLVLFYPYQAAGAYAAPLWPLAFLLVARAGASRRDFAFSLVLEILSGVLAAASVAFLLYARWAERSYLPLGIALLAYALLYTWVAVRSRFWWYLYPAAASAVAAYFLGFFSGVGAKLFLAQFLPLAAVLYALAARLRRRGRNEQAIPLDLAASAGVAAGVLRFVILPYGAHLTLGWATGLAYFALYLLLAKYTPDRIFFAGAGLAAAFTVYELLPLAPVVTGANRLGYFIPVAFLLALLGWLERRRGDLRGGRGLYAAAIVTTALASLFAVWPAPASPATARLVLLVAMGVWLALLLWTAHEIFIYCGTLALAMLAYNFVQSSADIFGQHLVAFFLYGTAILGLIFLAAAARNLVRFRRPVLFVAPERAYQRLLYLFPITLLGLATFGSWGVVTTSNPHFCGTCHSMNRYFANWNKSPHARANVGCDACHYEPGMRGYFKAKLQGTSELVTTLTGTQTFKPMAEVSNQTCLRGGCHSTDELARPLQARGLFYFNHAAHLGQPRRGLELRCTSCHTDVNPDTHFGVDTNACFTCHFKTASEPQPATAVGCVRCHGVPKGERGASGFNHVSAGVTASDENCLSCHQGLTRGSTAIEERRCRHCHVQRPAELVARGSVLLHRKHVTERAVGCDWCHGVVKHSQAVDSARLD